MAGERMTWDHHADHDLLTAMILELQPTTEQLRGIMNRMHGFGHSCTVKAITQHLQKLRRKEGGAAAANANGGDDGPAPDTPKRKRAPAGKKAGGAAAKKKGGKAAPKQEDDSEEDVKSSPKKVKVEKEVQSPLNDDEDVLPPFAEF